MMNYKFITIFSILALFSANTAMFGQGCVKYLLKSDSLFALNVLEKEHSGYFEDSSLLAYKHNFIQRSKLLTKWGDLGEDFLRQFTKFEKITLTYFLYSFHSEEKLIISVQNNGLTSFYEFESACPNFKFVGRLSGYNHFERITTDIMRIGDMLSEDFLGTIILRGDCELEVAGDNRASPAKYNVLDRVLNSFIGNKN